MNSIWMLEVKVNNQYTPYQAELTRDNARSLQRYLKATKSISVPSRIRRYSQDVSSRG